MPCTTQLALGVNFNSSVFDFVIDPSGLDSNEINSPCEERNMPGFPFSMARESREKQYDGKRFCGALIFSKVASGRLFQRKNDGPLVPSEKQKVLLSRIAILHAMLFCASSDFQVGPVARRGFVSLNQIRAILPLDKGIRI